MTLSSTIPALFPRESVKPAVFWAVVAVLCMVMGGCSSAEPARTWPEVIDRHWFATGFLAAFVAVVFISGLVRVVDICKSGKEATP